MTDLRVIGIDPGPIPGLVVLNLSDRADGEGRWLESTDVLQCTPGLLYAVLETTLLATHDETLVQAERFVVGKKSMKSGAPGGQTRDMVGAIASTVLNFGLGTDHRMVQRSAAAVKPWATDERLEAAGLLAATKGMRHSRDAARHALFAACHDGGLLDPLSRKASR